MSKDINLLDTPGILWPKFEDQTVAYKLAFIGSINDNILDITDISYNLLKFLKEHYPDNIIERYNLEPDALSTSEDELLYRIAMARSCLKKGGEPDIEKASKIIIDDLRSRKLGRITFDIK